MSFEDLKIKNTEQTEAAQKDINRQVQEEAYRFHRVFVQNPDGAKILERWINLYCFGSFTSNEASVTELAKAEARREFVAAIISQLNRVKTGQ